MYLIGRFISRSISTFYLFENFYDNETPQFTLLGSFGEFTKFKRNPDYVFHSSTKAFHNIHSKYKVVCDS